jgi:hypothetical protein
MSGIERVVVVKRRGDADQPWTYWLTRTPQERLAMVEELRREHHGWTAGAEPRLQRVHQVLRRS